MSIRIRYNVESPGRFRSHMHVVDGAGYFFYPGKTAAKGERVLLEVAFDLTGETILLRGWVWTQPRKNGMWLELNGVEKAMEWAESFSRRMDNRVGTEQLVLVEGEGKPGLLCRLRDVSSGGARLGAIPSDVGTAGDRVRISLPEAGPGGIPLDGQAFVSWSSEGEIGLTWMRSDLRTRIAAARLVELAEQEWDSATQTQHLATCKCAGPRKVEQPIVMLG